jgi:hypothetical protein
MLQDFDADVARVPVGKKRVEVVNRSGQDVAQHHQTELRPNQPP